MTRRRARRAKTTAKARRTKGGSARAVRQKATRGEAADLARLDVFHHLFAAAAEEMGAALMRSSFSPNIRERRDFSCALFDGRGRMVGQASHLPVHLGSTPLSVQAAIEHVPMGPGDAVLMNDPYRGGTHLPDLTLVSPVCLPGEDEPAFYCANRAHHADVGGAAPGSMAPQLDVHGEGLRIPPILLVRGGEVDQGVLELVLANMRVPRERKGDLLAQWSTNRIGEARLLELAAEYGAAEVRLRAAQLMDWTEGLTRALLRELPDGRYEFEDELEESAPATIRVSLIKRGDRLECDFRATDSCPESASHATRAVTVSAVFYVVRTLLPPGTPTNEGILRPLTIRTKPGTLVDAAYPHGVAAGNVETSQRIVDVLLGALAQALPERIPAASAGTMSNFTFGGVDAEGEAYTYYETIAGGAGAGPGQPGASAIQTHMTNTRNTPIEEFEATYPARILRLEVRRDSGGSGRFRGGDGIRKRIRFLRPAQVAFVGERTEHGPWGLSGGSPGKPARLVYHPTAQAESQSSGARTLPGKVALRVEAGDELSIETPGAGAHELSGFGVVED